MKTADGKTVKKHCLIRSGALFDAAPEDLQTLVRDYGMHTVVDLRMPAEITGAPDPVPDGCRYEALSLLDESFFGIARDEYSVLTWLGIFSDKSLDPDDVFCEMYRKLVFDERVKPLYRRFFEILLQNESGAVLWHCSAGKDRAGVAAMLTLAALGVDEKTIVADYMQTAVYTASEIEQARAFARAQTSDAHILKAVDALMGTKPRNVEQLFRIAEERYGGWDAFFTEENILSSEALSSLRERYLEI